MDANKLLLDARKQNETYLLKLFIELLNRGCIIEVNHEFGYVTKYLPECLVLINLNMQNKCNYIIKAISNDKMIAIKNDIFYNDVENKIVFNHCCLSPLFTIEINVILSSNFLNMITQYVYGHCFANDFYDHDFYHSSANRNMDYYKKILKNKMIQNLLELYLIKYMYVTSKMICLTEIKIVIVEILFKLDKWNILEYINS